MDHEDVPIRISANLDAGDAQKFLGLKTSAESAHGERVPQFDPVNGELSLPPKCVVGRGVQPVGLVMHGFAGGEELFLLRPWAGAGHGLGPGL